MRGALFIVLLALSPARGQSVLDGARLPEHLRRLAPQPGDQKLRCEVTPMKPTLDFGFRFQAGYDIAVPMGQYWGSGHGWVVLSRVTPERGKPVWLAARVVLPDVPITSVVTHTFGGFLVGAGKYRVDWAMYDDEGRVCRSHWNIDAKLRHGEQHVEPAMPELTVSDFAGSGLPRRPALGADAPPFRLTVLLHAAPANPRRMHFRGNDRVLLLSTLSALLDRVQPSGVRLAVFNFDKQKIIYSSDNFTLRSIGEVNNALNRLQLETIDVNTLRHPAGHENLLSSMIGGETGSAKPSDAVVFLGPMARYVDRLPASAFGDPPEGMRFFYFQYRPFTLRAGPRPDLRALLPDTIAHAVSDLKGRVFPIYSPGQFADAIRELEKLRH